MTNEQKEARRKWLYFKNGKPKKKYMYCISKEKLAEMKRIHGYAVVQCAGLQCPFYPVGCGRSDLKKWEAEHNGV